jgi:hypothetical protein
MMRAAGISLVGLALVFSATLVSAAVPQKVIVSGGTLAAPIEIVDLHDTGEILVHLCSDQRAGDLAGRPFFDIVVQWIADDPSALTWRGKLYPAVGDRPAAVDIPDWQLYTNSATEFCDRRVAGAAALQVLARYGVPTEIGVHLPQTSASRSTGGIIVLAVLAGMLFLAGIGTRRRGG